MLQEKAFWAKKTVDFSRASWRNAHPFSNFHRFCTKTRARTRSGRRWPRWWRYTTSSPPTFRRRPEKPRPLSDNFLNSDYYFWIVRNFGVNDSPKNIFAWEKIKLHLKSSVQMNHWYIGRYNWSELTFLVALRDAADFQRLQMKSAAVFWLAFIRMSLDLVSFGGCNVRVKKILAV